MHQHPWQEAWIEKRFIMQTQEPSVLVTRYEGSLHPGDWVLDVGTGNGRNAQYLAAKGMQVDAFDVINLIDSCKLPASTQRHLHFTRATTADYPYPSGKYHAVIIARVIQYLSPDELANLLYSVRGCLRSNGFLLLSYTTSGGVFSETDVTVPKYEHPIEEIANKLQAIFVKVTVSPGACSSTHVNYQHAARTFDIYATGVRKQTMSPH